MSEKIFELPATFEMKVWFTDGEQTGQVTITLPVGKYPTQTKTDEMIEEAKKAISKSDLHICDPSEFCTCVLLEETGQYMVMGGPNEWATPYSSEEN